MRGHSEALIGSGQDVSVVEFEGEHTAPAEIVSEITNRLIRRLSAGRAA